MDSWEKQHHTKQRQMKEETASHVSEIHEVGVGKLRDRYRNSVTDGGTLTERR